MSQIDNNKIVRTGIIIGAVGTLLIFIIFYVITPKFGSEVELLDRIKLGVECLALPAAFFLVTVIKVGTQRFGNPSDNPIKVAVHSDSMEINLRVLSNTHEQVVIFALNTLLLSVLLPYMFLSLLPIYSGVFLLGRILFWAAYKHNPLWRAPGFAMGILPGVVGLSYGCIVVLLQVFSNV